MVFLFNKYLLSSAVSSFLLCHMYLYLLCISTRNYYKSIYIRMSFPSYIFTTFISEGKMHDSAMLARSGLPDDLEQFAYCDGTPMCVYGDPAYPLRVHLQAPYRDLEHTVPMQNFNKSMSTVRVTVEWIFGDIINSFKFMDFKKNLKICLSCVGKMYIVAALLRNALTCLQSNLTSHFFDLEPPSLETYFS